MVKCIVKEITCKSCGGKSQEDISEMFGEFVIINETDDTVEISNCSLCSGI